MANANINIQLSNGKQAGQTINELRQQANRLTREVNNLKPGTEEFVKKSQDLKKVTGRLGEVRKEAKGVSQASKGMVDQMMQFIPFGGQIQAVTGKVRLLSGGFKTLRAAIISTGIGALVVVLGTLINYLLSTQAGMDKVTAVTRPLMAIFEKMQGVVQELGGSVFKGLAMILNGDIKEGLKTLGNGFKDAVGNTKEAIEEGWEAGKQLDKLQKLIEETENDLIVRRAELNAQYQKTKEIAQDTSKTDEERAKAARAAMNAQNELLKLEQDFLDLKIEKMKLEHTLNDTSRADKKELAQLEAERINFEAQAARKRASAVTLLNSVRKKAATEAAEDEVQITADKVEKIGMLEAELDIQKLDFAKMASDRIKQIKDSEVKHHEQAEKAKAEFTRQHAAQALAGLGNVFGQLASMHEEGSEQHKKFAKAQAMISTFQAAINAYMSLSAIPVVGPALGTAAAAAAMAFGMEQVKAIEKQKMPTAEAKRVEYEHGGILRGNRHSNGGIPGVIRSSGQPIEMEDGEIILNRKVGMSAFGRAAASNLNAMFGGTKFESGGPVNPLTTTSGGGAPAPVQPGRENIVLAQKFDAFANEIRTWQRKLVVVNNLQDTREGLNTLNNLQDNVDI